jgi:hypothetical protein
MPPLEPFGILVNDALDQARRLRTLVSQPLDGGSCPGLVLASPRPQLAMQLGDHVEQHREICWAIVANWW